MPVERIETLVMVKVRVTTASKFKVFQHSSFMVNIYLTVYYAVYCVAVLLEVPGHFTHKTSRML